MAQQRTTRLSTDQPQAWLTKPELARVLRCSTRTIERLRPPSLRVGGQNRYRLSEVEAFLRDVPFEADPLGFQPDPGS